MSEPWALVGHEHFKINSKKLVEDDKSLQHHIDSRLDLLRTNPIIPRFKVKYMPPDLAGRLYKTKAGGRRGHNIYYLPFSNKKSGVVLIAIITLINRGETDYTTDIPIEEIQEALDDFSNQRKEKLEIL